MRGKKDAKMKGAGGKRRKKKTHLLRKHRVIGRRRGAVAAALADPASASPVIRAAPTSTFITAAQRLRASILCSPLLLDRHPGVGLAQGDVGIRRRQRRAERARGLPGARDREDLERQGVPDEGALKGGDGVSDGIENSRIAVFIRAGEGGGVALHPRETRKWRQRQGRKRRRRRSVRGCRGSSSDAARHGVEKVESTRERPHGVRPLHDDAVRGQLRRRQGRREP